ncbi:hypothetical protein L249_0211, partial [Ophiocordyceps polyrhachis-furcata BCC 54312]
MIVVWLAMRLRKTCNGRGLFFFFFIVFFSTIIQPRSCTQVVYIPIPSFPEPAPRRHGSVKSKAQHIQTLFAAGLVDDFRPSRQLPHPEARPRLVQKPRDRGSRHGARTFRAPVLNAIAARPGRSLKSLDPENGQ